MDCSILGFALGSLAIYAKPNLCFCVVLGVLYGVVYVRGEESSIAGLRTLINLTA